MRLFEEYQSPKSPCGPGIHVPYRPSCMTSKKPSSIKMTKWTTMRLRIRQLGRLRVDLYYETLFWEHLRSSSFSPHVGESGFPNPGNFCLWNPEFGKFLLLESEILAFGIRNTAQEIRNSSNH